MGMPESREKVDERKEDQHFEIVVHFFWLAMIFWLAMNKVMVLMNTDCCMKVVELEILRKTLLNCSHASELALRREGYDEVLKLDEQVLWLFS